MGSGSLRLYGLLDFVWVILNLGCRGKSLRTGFEEVGPYQQSVCGL